MNTHAIEKLIERLKQIQANFYTTFGVTDIITNSKIFEILIADTLNHKLIPGHSGTRDAKNNNGGEFEYKHYKETSSNHSWTFNDFSNTTIKKLKDVESVIFAHIQDEGVSFPIFDWYYEVPGKVMAEYLLKATKKVTNNRKMINVSPAQIEKNLYLTKKITPKTCSGIYSSWIKNIVDVISKIETGVGTTGILTSNKFWEVLVALKLGHQVQSEQAKHDAIDSLGNTYEYKVSKKSNWSFQDISEKVLNKYTTNKSIILAIVDKNNLTVETIYEVDTKKTIRLLQKKLKEKQERYASRGKEIRRRQASLSAKDARNMNARVVYYDKVLK